MTKVKICGLKRREDILAVNKLKPDYVGFVFAKSKRQIDKYKAKELIYELDKSIKTVGVFLNHPYEAVKEIAEYCNLDIIQLHGDESSQYCSLFRKDLWKAFRIKNENCLRNLDSYNANGYLLDTYVKGEYGGTGEVFNWEIASKAGQERFIILAGGLSNENVEEAIKTAKPTVVDVSSGVETDGYKDFYKIKKFIEKVRRTI